MSNPTIGDFGTRKGWECTNAHGIIRIQVNDCGLVLTMHYDNGKTYQQCIEFPHMVRDYPAKRGRWSFQGKDKI